LFANVSIYSFLPVHCGSIRGSVPSRSSSTHIHVANIWRRQTADARTALATAVAHLDQAFWGAVKKAAPKSLHLSLVWILHVLWDNRCVSRKSGYFFQA